MSIFLEKENIFPLFNSSIEYNKVYTMFFFRFSGAICGFVYIYTLPTMLHLASQRKRNLLTLGSVIFHVLISLIGLANLIAQFFVWKIIFNLI